MDIGTGKPAPSISDTVTHHCLSLVTPGAEFSVFQWLPLAVEAMQAAWEAGAEVWVSGGTGLYIRALIERLPLGAPPRPALRLALQRRIELLGPRKVAAELGLDLSESANPRRVLRAAEQACEEEEGALRTYRWARLADEDAAASDSADGARYLGALARLADWECSGVWVLDPGRESLAAAIAERVAGMFAGGLVEEAAELRRRGLAGAACVADGIAYREALALLDGKLRLEEAVEQAVIRTRQYAKRQRTYFRGQNWPALPAELAAKPSAGAAAAQSWPEAEKIAAEFAPRP